MQPNQSQPTPEQPVTPMPQAPVAPQVPPQSAPPVVPIQVSEQLAETALVDAAPITTSDQPIHWQATEYIHHEKNAFWFVVFGVVVLVFMAVAILLIKSVTFAILIPVMAAALLVYTHRPPRILDYTLSAQGLHINDKLYPLGSYKSFGIIRDSGEYSVMLVPVKRFQPGVTVYFPEEAGEAIVDLLGARLPMQDLHLDAIDRIIRKLRI